MSYFDRLDPLNDFPVHDVAMPYRGDGVARALDAIFHVPREIPIDMTKLLHKLDSVPAR